MVGVSFLRQPPSPTEARCSLWSGSSKVQIAAVEVGRSDRLRFPCRSLWRGSRGVSNPFLYKLTFFLFCRTAISFSSLSTLSQDSVFCLESFISANRGSSERPSAFPAHVCLSQMHVVWLHGPRGAFEPLFPCCSDRLVNSSQISLSPFFVFREIFALFFDRDERID